MMRLKLIITSLAVLTCLVSLSSFARAQDVGWVGDLPVPAEALINTQNAIAFDSPSGRVVKFSFYTDFNEQQIAQFYQNVLASLGWQANDDIFERDGEVMMITKTGTASDGSVIYQLSLTPRS